VSGLHLNILCKIRTQRSCCNKMPILSQDTQLHINKVSIAVCVMDTGWWSYRQSYGRLLEWMRQFTIQLFSRRTHCRMVRHKVPLPTVS